VLPHYRVEVKPAALGYGFDGGCPYAANYRVKNERTGKRNLIRLLKLVECDKVTGDGLCFFILHAFI